MVTAQTPKWQRNSTRLPRDVSSSAFWRNGSLRSSGHGSYTALERFVEPLKDFAGRQIPSENARFGLHRRAPIPKRGPIPKRRKTCHGDERRISAN
jgi:hypothetical protein